VKGFEPGIIYSKTEQQPYIELWEQPALRRMAANLYHWWEMHSIFFMKHVSRWHTKLFGNKDEFFIPLINRQDLRCDYLNRKSRRHLATIHVTEEQYAAITGRTIKEHFGE